MSLHTGRNPKNLYQWEESALYLPGFVKGVPEGEGFSIQKLCIFLVTAISSLLGLLTAQSLHLFPYLIEKLISGELIFTSTADLGLTAIFAEFNNWRSLDEFDTFFKPWTLFTKPEVAEDWDRDREFGRQRLNGMNPVLIRKCQREDLDLRGNFPVTSVLINPVKGEEINLETAFTDNRLYIVEYKILEQIVSEQLEDQLGRYTESPIGLFYVDDQQDLLPIAIKLRYDNDLNNQKYNRIFTPNSPPAEWLTAKAIFSSADCSYQGIVSHLLQTHLIIEPFAVSTYRRLSPEHILHQLLKPHYFNTLAINNMARSTFLGRGGFFDQTGDLGYTGSNELLNRGYNGYKDRFPELLFYQLALPYNLKLRDVSELPGYYYRDDAVLIWDAIKKYVSDVLQVDYKSDADIINDREIQAWKEELINYGKIKGLLPPEKNQQLTGLADLIEMATTIIFIATAQHSAVNFGQYDYAGWIPNQAFALYKSADDLVENTDKYKELLLQRLPDRLQTIKQMILVKVLTLAPPYTSDSLLTLKNPFLDSSAADAFANFQNSLTQIEAQISKRNASLSKPYTYLLPSRIPQSIAI